MPENNMTLTAVLSTEYNETQGPFYVKIGDTHGTDPFIINNLTLTITLPEITASTPTLYWRWMYWLEYRVVSGNSSLTTWKSLPFPNPADGKLVEESVTDTRADDDDYNAHRIITINWSGKDYKALPLSAGGFEIQVKIQPHGNTKDESVKETDSRNVLSQIAAWEGGATTVCSVKNPYLSCITNYGNKQTLYADASLGHPDQLTYKIQSHTEGADTLNPAWYFTGSSIRVMSDDTDNTPEDIIFTDLLPCELDGFYQTEIYIGQITDNYLQAKEKLQIRSFTTTKETDSEGKEIEVIVEHKEPMKLSVSELAYSANLKIQLAYGYKMCYGPVNDSNDIIINSESPLDLGQLYYDYGYRPSWAENQEVLYSRTGGR